MTVGFDKLKVLSGDGWGRCREWLFVAGVLALTAVKITTVPNQLVRTLW
jgi:hypothetical protein